MRVIEPPRSLARATVSVIAPPRAIAPHVAGIGRFWIQVGAFRSIEKAMRAAESLRAHAVSLLTAPDQPLLKVQVGPFANRDAAASKLREIRALGYDAAFIAEATR
jgi:cell division septation protein DedD